MKATAIIGLISAILLGISGFLLVGIVSWKIAFGVFLMLWGNNIGAKAQELL